MRHSQKLLGDINLDIEKEECKGPRGVTSRDHPTMSKRVSHTHSAHAEGAIRGGVSLQVRPNGADRVASSGRGRECGRVYASVAIGRGGTVLSCARAAAGAGVAAGEGWGGFGGCRRGSVRMISEGVSTRMCASASRSPPAVTVTLGARTPPVTAASAGVLVATLAPAALPPGAAGGPGAPGGAGGAGAGAGAATALPTEGAAAAGWLGSPSPAVCRAPNCLHHVARERTTACP